MAATVMDRSDFSTITTKIGLRKVFLNAYQHSPMEFEAWANIGSSTKRTEEDHELFGFPAVQDKPEGTPTQYAKAGALGTKVYTHVAHGLGFRITIELDQDDQYDKVSKFTRELGLVGRISVDLDVVKILNEATSASRLGIDGKALLSETHPLAGSGGTFSNRPTIDTDISFAAVQAAITHFDTLVNEQGFPIEMSPQMAIITPVFRFIAAEIFKQEFKPNTTDRDMNTVRDIFAEFKVSKYMLADGRWFVITHKGEFGHQLNVIWRSQTTFDVGVDFDSGDKKVKMFNRYSFGHTSARGVYGSPGAP